MKLKRYFFSVYLIAVLNSNTVFGGEVLNRIPIGLIEPDIPFNNLLTKKKVELGEKLFFDARLSSTGLMSCATCHDPKHGFAENRAISFDAAGDKLERNAPSILNSGYLATVNWDGRFKTLEDQIMQPFSKKGDLRIEIEEALQIIESSNDYKGLFENAFGRPVDKNSVGDALASFQRSLISANSRFDDYLFKNDSCALSDNEKKGYELFIGKASCIACHDIFHPTVNSLGGAVALFSDHRFHNIGVGYKNGKMTDMGRYWTTRRKEDWGSFKTPMLRNVALTSPYMHDGSLPTLTSVIEFYNKGGNPNPNLAPGIRPLLLNEEEISNLVAFLESLTDRSLSQ
jgi:cytochrome c peroxidase